VLARDFENADITVPSPQLVKAYNEFAEPNLAQIQNLRLQNQKLKLARDLLLPRLMRGEIAV
jgi:type I restriction enzyme, S subunit